jgi:hypothetical protein
MMHMHGMDDLASCGVGFLPVFLSGNKHMEIYVYIDVGMRKEKKYRRDFFFRFEKVSGGFR